MRAERAIPIAARIARTSSGSVVLARVVSKPSGLWPSVAPQTTLVQQILADDLAEAEGYLSVAATSPELQGVITETQVRFGPAVSSILAVADSCQSDLIVLCSHGYTGITRRIMGSVAEKLAREASVPVLVLREGGSVPGGTYPDTHPLRALVPLDGSAGAKAALEPAAHLIAALAGSAPGELHLMRVVQSVAASSDEGGMLTASQKARGYLGATAGHIRDGLVAPAVAQHNLAVSWSVAVDSYVAETLVRTAENAEAVEEDGTFADFDVIALATHGHDGWQRWVMGSVTEHILLGTKLPLLIVPPQGQRIVETEEEDAEIRQRSRSGVFSLA